MHPHRLPGAAFAAVISPQAADTALRRPCRPPDRPAAASRASRFPDPRIGLASYMHQGRIRPVHVVWSGLRDAADAVTSCFPRCGVGLRWVPPETTPGEDAREGGEFDRQ